jgi:hypothetical protein
MHTTHSSGGAGTTRDVEGDGHGDDRPFISLSRAPENPRTSSVLTNAFEMLDSMNHLPGHISNLPNDHLDTGQMISVPQQTFDESGYSLALSAAGSESCDVTAGMSDDRGVRGPLHAQDCSSPSMAFEGAGALDREGSSSNTQPLLMPQSLEEVCRPCGHLLYLRQARRLSAPWTATLLT